MLHKPKVYPHGEFSDFAKKIAAEGYEVEKYVKALLMSQDDAETYKFQEIFQTGEGLLARVLPP